mgnify:CR=1 FL=1
MQAEEAAGSGWYEAVASGDRRRPARPACSASVSLPLEAHSTCKLSGVAQIRLYVDNGYLYTSKRSSIMQAEEAAAPASPAAAPY